jgi:hypothetical protein
MSSTTTHVHSAEEEHTCMKVRFLDGIQPTQEQIQKLESLHDVVDVEQDPTDPGVLLFKTVGCEEGHCKNVARSVAKAIPGMRIEWSSLHKHPN